MKTLITLLVAGIFTSNLITYNLLGVEGIEKGRDKTLLDLLKRGLVTAALLVGFTAVSYPLGKWVIEPLGLGFLSSLIYILILSKQTAKITGRSASASRYLPRQGMNFSAARVIPKRAPKMMSI